MIRRNGPPDDGVLGVKPCDGPPDGGVLDVKRFHLTLAVQLAAVACGWLLLTGAGFAEEPRVLRVVGVQPLDASAAKAGGPRQGAIDAALFEAVSRVAHELVDEYGPVVPAEGTGDAVGGEGDDGSQPPAGALPEGWLKQSLGKDMTPFARSFRIIEDQGSRPVLFKGETEATREYVVVVEATVDVEKVRDRLAAKGIISVEREEIGDDGVEIEALGLRHWSGYEAFVAVLEGPGVRASEVRPLEFEAGRALVYAVVRGSAEDVLTRVLAAAPPELEVTGTDVTYDDGVPRIQLKLLWTPPAAPAGH